MSKIQRAIVSVSDKTGIVEFCRQLSKLNIEIISTGGTAKHLKEGGVKSIEVSEYTGFPEVMGGRLKTLHPKIEGGILARRSEDDAQMRDLNILPIDLVVVNLYPFEQIIAQSGVSLEDVIEQIDIGGPTMLRAAAKNYKDVLAVVDPGDYPLILEELGSPEKSNEGLHYQLAVKVFEHTARYDAVIANYLRQRLAGFPNNLTMAFEKIADLRYGENPHQKAAVYRELPRLLGSLVEVKQLHGKELSFNNYIDLEAAYQVVRSFERPACAIIKHTNPCGCALGDTLEEAYERALAGDPVSSFGGIVGFNREVDAVTAKGVSEVFFECVMAPSYQKEALEILRAKKNIRLMELPMKNSSQLDFKRIGGGLLVQDKDTVVTPLASAEVPTKRKPTVDEIVELDFAWKVVRHIKSNAILFSKNCQVLGVGAGQMSRVDSVKIAGMKATQSLAGAVMASDAFFPFRDGLDTAAKLGITAVVQPGGSLRDEEVIDAADEAGIAMVFTGIRHFKH